MPTITGIMYSDRFLSTLSLRRATCLPPALIPAQGNFYPRSPCGERLAKHLQTGTIWAISIHALLAESDYGTASSRKRSLHFYPRSPCGERLFGAGCVCACFPISIHALLAESDCRRVKGYLPSQYFYPRSPCGERPLYAARPCAA